MPICQGIRKDVKSISKMCNLNISEDLKEYISEKTEEYLESILEEADLICKSQKRKMITNLDIKEVLENTDCPFFTNLYEKSN